MLFPPLGLPPIGPPFGRYPEAPALSIVTDIFRPCSAGAEGTFAVVLPLTTAEGPSAGTAGVMGPLPFTAATESDFPWCADADPPTAPDGFEVFVADVGGDCFLVALA